MRVTFQSADITSEKKGRAPGYNKAVVTYLFNGEPRKQTIVSFKNPGVYKAITELQPGTEIEVEYSKDESGYTQWTSVAPAGAREAPAAGNGPAVTRVVQQRDYESKNERAYKQAAILRQNALGNAIAFVGTKATGDVEEVLAVAEQFLEWTSDVEVDEQE